MVVPGPAMPPEAPELLRVCERVEPPHPAASSASARRLTQTLLIRHARVGTGAVSRPEPFRATADQRRRALSPPPRFDRGRPGEGDERTHRLREAEPGAPVAVTFSVTVSATETERELQDAALLEQPTVLPPAPPRAVLRAIAFVVGSASLGAEIAAARLLAPYFGASTIIWPNTMATV